MITTAFGIFIFILVLSILVFIHELGHFLAAKKMGIKVDEFAIGFPPRAWGKKIGETLYSINWLPIGGFVKVYGEEYHEDEGKISKEDRSRAFVYKKPWQKLFVLVAGVVMNFLLGWAIYTFMFTQGIPQPTGIVEVGSVSENSPAEAGGIEVGDRIVRIEHEGKTYPIERFDQLVSTTSQFAGTQITYVIERNNEELRFDLTPRKDPPPGEGSLGVGLNNETAFEIKKYSILEAPLAGLQYSGKIIVITVQELGKVVTRLFSAQPIGVELTGPIGIAAYTTEATQYGPMAILELMALLSLNLAIINILPFPALDGGRVVFVLYEWITGKKVNTTFERNLNFFGIMTLLLLIVVVTYFDIVKLISGN